MPSFQFGTRLNSKNRNETSLLMNTDTLICIWILAFPIGIIQISTTRKWRYLLYFSSLHDYKPPTTLISLVHNSFDQNGVMWKTCFTASQNAKNESQLNHKNQVRDRLLYWQLGLRIWKIIIVITWWAHKRQMFTLISIKLMWILKLFVYK